MIDRLIDEQLKRVTRAVAQTSPEPPRLGPGPSRRPRPAERAVVWGFVLALVVGAVSVVLVTEWRPWANEPSTPTGSGGQSRWDWIIQHSRVVSEDLWVADPAGTPVPAFDYAQLGVEQLLTSGDPAVPSFNPLGDGDVQLPWVYVGTISRPRPGSGPAPVAVLVRAIDVRTDPERLGQTLLCLTVFYRGADTACFDPDGLEPTDEGGILGGVHNLASPGTPQGELVVDFWLPRETAVVLLTLDDGRSFVERPMLGVALFVIQDLAGAGLESADALDAEGQVIIHQDLRSLWEDTVEALVETTTTVVAGGEATPVTVPEDDRLLVLGTIALDPIPDVLACSGAGGVPVEGRPNQGGSVTLPAFESPIAALRGFLNDNPGEPPLATSGYWAITQTDDSIVFGKPLSEGTILSETDFGIGFVTLIEVVPNDGGWTVTSWTASGC